MSEEDEDKDLEEVDSDPYVDQEEGKKVPAKAPGHFALFVLATANLHERAQKKERGRVWLVIFLTMLMSVGYIAAGAKLFSTTEVEYRQKVRTEIVGWQGDYCARVEGIFKLYKEEDGHKLTRQMLYNFTIQLIDYIEMFKYPAVRKHEWTFEESILFSITLVCMVGFGDVVPRAPNGRFFTTCYAFIGIPIVISFARALSDSLARGFKRCLLLSREIVYNEIPPELEELPEEIPQPVEGQPEEQPPDENQNQTENESETSGESGESGEESPTEAPPPPAEPTPPPKEKFSKKTIPIIVPVIVLCGYAGLGAGMFIILESKTLDKWNIEASLYFAVTSLTTIGFGDIVYGRCGRYISEQLSATMVETCKGPDAQKLVITGVYIIVGVVITLMCVKHITVTFIKSNWCMVFKLICVKKKSYLNRAVEDEMDEYQEAQLQEEEAKEAIIVLAKPPTPPKEEPEEEPVEEEEKKEGEEGEGEEGGEEEAKE